MYIPADFDVRDEDELYGIIDRYGFGTLVSAGTQGLAATLAPFVVSHGSSSRRLFGHLARANPQARELSSVTEALAIFRGPDAYISPSWYADAPNVPTWNFVAVHVYGVPRVLDRDDPQVRWVLERTVDRFESELEEPWRLELPEDYVGPLLRGVVAFELCVTALQGQFKLSQNQPHENRLGVIENLERRPESTAREVAALMRALEGPS